MSKYLVALLAVSISVVAFACGGPAKSPETPAAASATPEAAPSATPSASPAAEPPK